PNSLCVITGIDARPSGRRTSATGINAEYILTIERIRAAFDRSGALEPNETGLATLRHSRLPSSGHGAPPPAGLRILRRAPALRSGAEPVPHQRPVLPPGHAGAAAGGQTPRGAAAAGSAGLLQPGVPGLAVVRRVAFPAAGDDRGR